MDVTRSNLASLFELIRDAITTSDLLAFDWELTGLQLPVSSGHAGTPSLETLQEYYTKNRGGAQNYTVTQFGLCTVRFVDDSRGCVPFPLAEPTLFSFEVRPFNFWLFPRKFRASEPVFSVQASSLEFLAQNHFDFNKWVRDGIGFLPRREIQKLQIDLENREKNLAQMTKIVPNEADQKAVEERLSAPHQLSPVEGFV